MTTNNKGILGYFERENKKQCANYNNPCDNALFSTTRMVTNITPLMELKKFIGKLRDTFKIKKDDSDKLFKIIEKNFPLTAYCNFEGLINKLRQTSECTEIKQEDNETEAKYNCDHDHDKQKIKLEDFQELLRLFSKTYEDKYSFSRNVNDNTCINMIANKIINTYDNIHFTTCQNKAIYKMLEFLYDPNAHVFGLFGYAGTGKTTLITKFVKTLVSMKYINSINFSAPTNKAVNVIKNNFADCVEQLVLLHTPDVNNYDSLTKQLDYLSNKGININLNTIHKLLEYKQDLNNKGEKVFIKNKASSNKILMNSDLIIIDECSMLETQIIVDLFKTINENKTNCAIKIILIGDPAQLAPVKELTSCVFNTKLTEFKENILTSHFDIKTTYSLTQFTNDVIKYERIILDEIVRSSNANVKKLCEECRKWVLGTINLPNLVQYKCENIKIYRVKPGVKKVDSLWFKRYINYVKRDIPVNNIILTWRNSPTDEYNTTIRKMLFKKPNIGQYEAGDILMMNEFYLLRPIENTNITSVQLNGPFEAHKKDNKLYTCEQIKVIEATKIKHSLKKITEPKIPEEYTKLIGTKVRKLISDINAIIPNEYQVWKLIVKKLADNDINDKIHIEENNDTYSQVYDLLNSKYALLTHKEDMIEKVNSDKTYIKKKMNDFSEFLELKFSDKNKFNMLTEKIVIELWKQINAILEDPFANVNICFSMTTHKSQSSTYYNVFVDVDDIISNNNDTDVRKCLYTAVTRTSHELHLLI